MIEITHTPLRFPSFPLCLGMGMLGTTATLSGIMGVTLTMAIGGADMPGNISPHSLSFSLVLLVPNNGSFLTLNIQK